MSGIILAVISHDSNNMCLKNAIDISDSLVEYSYTSAITEREGWIDWTLWGLGIGSLISSAGKTLYWCYLTDPNFGKTEVETVPSGSFLDVIAAPWTIDFVLSLAGVISSIKMAITQYSEIDPYFMSKKVM